MNIIRNQHNDIFNAFDYLKHLVETHIDTENSLLDIRNENKPRAHINVNAKIRAHKEKHEEFLQKIIDLGKELEKHITMYDNLHIHKL
jgi:hypothetical protein